MAGCLLSEGRGAKRSGWEISEQEEKVKYVKFLSNILASPVHLYSV